MTDTEPGSAHSRTVGGARPPVNWLFVDMNSYFAAVEQQFRPQLRGRPVGVVPVAGTDRTCCIAASVQAKQYGVRTGTSVRDARRLCPDLAIVKARPSFYVQVHHRILAAIDRGAPIHKVYSIDEAAVRLVGAQRQRDAAIELARRIKQHIARDVGDVLTCSVGIAPTRLLAKIGSDLQKPDGLTVLAPDRLPDALAHLQLDDLVGISRGMLTRLRRRNIETIEQLYALDRWQMREAWGSVAGEHYWCGLHGGDTPEPATRRHSMGHAHVLPPRHRNAEGARGVMVRLLHKAAYRLRAHDYFARRLVVSVRFLAGRRWSEQVALPACQDTLTILEHFQRLWRRYPYVFGEPIKVSVTLTHLTHRTCTAGLLFDEARRRHALAHTIDRVNLRFGRDAVYFAGMHGCRHEMDEKIAFGRVPDEALLAPPKPPVG